MRVAEYTLSAGSNDCRDQRGNRCQQRRPGEHVCRWLPSADRALVLDLSGVDFLGVEGLRVLVNIGQQCQRTGLPWAMITSGAIQRLLRIADSIHPIPTARSVKEHLCVADVLDAHRANLGAFANGYLTEKHTTQASAISLALQFVSIVLAIVFMRVVDGPNRMRWYVLGAIGFAGYFSIPAILGIHVWTLALGNAIGTLGIAFAFEGIYKVWTQEKFPTLLRATAQGMTISLARLLAAGVALYTPLLLDAGPRVLFATLAALIAVATTIGYTINRIPRATSTINAREAAVLVGAR
jgi:hypothetical protein